MNKLYKAVGMTKQSVHQYAYRQVVFDKQVSDLIQQVDKLRKEHPGCGVEKMYDILKPSFIGRDRFIEVFMQLGYRIKRKRNYMRTTYASNRFYPNLIKGLSIDSPSTVWQSDITYIRVGERFYYATFIIDVYTRKIVGYNVSNHMRASANMLALRMALRNNKAPKIHHSDRGSQYTSNEYTTLLTKNESSISMGLIAQENAYAERINRTIKEEYLSYWTPSDITDLKRLVKRAVINYNTIRTHKGLRKQSPVNFENKWNQLKKNKREVLTIFNDEIIS